MKVALYARVSTDDKGQDTDVQLNALREFCRIQGYEIAGEYTDQASAADYIRRTSWARMMADASLHKFDAVMVWDLSRAFRQIGIGINTIDMLKSRGVAFKALKTPFLDSDSPAADLVRNVLLAVAEFERMFMIARINEGIVNARVKGTKSGKPFGRPRRPVPLDEVIAAWKKANGNKSEAARILMEKLDMKNITASNVKYWLSKCDDAVFTEERVA